MVQVLKSLHDLPRVKRCEDRVVSDNVRLSLKEAENRSVLGAGERSTEKRISRRSIDVPDGRPISGVCCDNVMII